MANIPADQAKVLALRAEYPILDQQWGNTKLVYLDNAATTQVPTCVLNRIITHYQTDNANVHRGIHRLSERSTAALEEARSVVASFIGASDPRSIVFTSGATSAINQVARGLESQLGPGQAVVVTALEHHANFVPWQQLCARTGASFIVAPLTEAGDIDREALIRILEENSVALCAFAHVSNVLGTVVPVAELTALAHSYGAKVLVDAAQSIRHEPVDVASVDCDYLVFSGHKMMAPTGIGVLYGKPEALECMEPSVFGGEMVAQVRFEATSFESLPLRLEAGTPNYVGAIALAEACAYLQRIGRSWIGEYERELLYALEEKLGRMGAVTILGDPEQRAGCLSFVVPGVHPFDIAQLLDTLGVAVRSGNQCAQPLLHQVYDVRQVVRVSPAFYNTQEELDQFVGALEKTLAVLSA